MAEPDRPDFGEPISQTAGEREPNLLPSEPERLHSNGIEPQFPGGPEPTFPRSPEPAPPLYAPIVLRSFPAWTFWDVLAILGATVFTIFACSAVALWLGHLLHPHLSMAALAQSPLLVVGSQMASYPIVIGLMAVMVRNRSREGFLRAIHWRWPGQSGAWFYLLGMALAFSIEGISHFLPIPKSLPMDKFFNDATSAYLMAFFGVLVAPVLEELFFRGMLYPILRRALGIVIGVTFTALAFAGIHGTQLGYAWAPILSIFFVGVALTLVREFTDSVAASVLTHSGYNFTLFVMLWFGTDHFRHLEKLGS